MKMEESEDLEDLEGMLELLKDKIKPEEEAKPEELPIQQITENEYMRRWYSALNRFHHYENKLTQEYKTKMNQVKSFIEDLYQQIQEVHLYSLDHRIQYFYNPNIEELLFVPIEKQVGFEDE